MGAPTLRWLTNVGRGYTQGRTRGVPNLALSPKLSSPKTSCSSHIHIDKPRAMSDKKSKNPFKYFTKKPLEGAPPGIAAGTLGLGEQMDVDPKGE